MGPILPQSPQRPSGVKSTLPIPITRGALERLQLVLLEGQEDTQDHPTVGTLAPHPHPVLCPPQGAFHMC